VERVSNWLKRWYSISQAYLRCWEGVVSVRLRFLASAEESFSSFFLSEPPLSDALSSTGASDSVKFPATEWPDKRLWERGRWPEAMVMLIPLTLERPSAEISLSRGDTGSP
jgi:hypothetical protein